MRQNEIGRAREDQPGQKLYYKIVLFLCIIFFLSTFSVRCDYTLLALCYCTPGGVCKQLCLILCTKIEASEFQRVSIRCVCVFFFFIHFMKIFPVFFGCQTYLSLCILYAHTHDRTVLHAVCRLYHHRAQTKSNVQACLICACERCRF